MYASQHITTIYIYRLTAILLLCIQLCDTTFCGIYYVYRSQITPELWHHKIPPPMKELHVIHPASVFGQPHKDRGRHYAIHPEWPTA